MAETPNNRLKYLVKTAESISQGGALTVTELSVELGLTRSRMSAIINGQIPLQRSNPEHDRIVRQICQIYDISPDQVWHGSIEERVREAGGQRTYRHATGLLLDILEDANTPQERRRQARLALEELLK